MVQRVTLLGSTGSVGKQTLQVISHLEGEFVVAALAVRENTALLEEQVKKYRPEVVAIYNKKKAAEFAKRCPEVRVLAGAEGLEEVATIGDIIVCAIVGAIAIAPTLASLRAGKRVAFASKEVLVMAGELVMKTAKEYGATIIPLDSEHSALMQCMEGKNQEEISRFILTASGGPFLGYTRRQLSHVTADEALRHPNWKMGAKVTVDCSTMMNKGLEVIEARWLFDLPLDKIDVVVHPQSLVHSFIEMVDGAMIAQIAEPEMVMPIQYALTYPKRKKGLLGRFDFKRHSKMEFFEPDMKTFQCLALAYEAGKIGGSMPCYMNAVNEVLVERFLQGKMGWSEIGEKLETLMSRHLFVANPTFDTLIEVDGEARKEANAG
ncbi:MAG: 1-deoxy-D-xylulose-5-phosphate reductoisomerase [Simkaniaceae bacterium]|nr:1-deoxy-D-xylulose-5-phosphate reductoisomerase [Simkaniaceae bacterium]